MRLPRTITRLRGRKRSRGQSLVEFALVLPLLLALTLIALDFGRVYLGWVNLQSMTRIAANLAANNPDAWTGSGDASVKARYQNQILNDAAAINCVLPKVGGKDTAPAPTFTGNQLGDQVSVGITCTFPVVTPVVRDIVGGSVAVSAASVFPVKNGMTAPGGGGSGSPPNAAFSGNGTLAPNPISGPAPFSVDFRDTSGGNPTSWLWEFNDGTPNSVAQDPLIHVFTLPGTYIVTMTATNAYGTTSTSMAVTVTTVSLVDFEADQTSGDTPLPVNFTDLSTSGGTNYTWDFGIGQGTATGQTVSHTYSTPGSYTVTLTVTYPTGDVSTTKTNYITVGPGLCTVPHLDGVRRYNADTKWGDQGFTGSVSDGPGAPSGNYTITTQSLTAESDVPCTSSVVVNRP